MSEVILPNAEQSADAVARRHRRRWLRLLLIPVVAYLVVILLFRFFENSLIFIPTAYPGGEWNPTGLRFEEAEFTSSDGVKLHGWYFEHPQPRAVLLFAHGNAGNLSHRGPFVQELVDMLDVSVLVFDYRGYGRSTGSPHEAGVLADARAARAWLAGRAGVSERDVVLYGESLGGGVAVDLAAHDGARGLVLENTFTSLPDAAAYHFPWLPTRWLMRSQLNSAATIRQYHGPLLVLHGDADTVIPYALGQQLFAAANEPKHFETIRGANHNDPRTPAFFQAFGAFLDGLPNKKPVGL